MTYQPIMVCDHGAAGTVSYHADSAADHANRWHSPDFPLNARLATRDEHASAGWNVSNYPVSVS
jgi:hypothetical protein